MANVTPASSSVGLMGLPHFRQSRVSRDLMEPIYLNLFTVTIQLPTALTTGDNPLVTPEDTNLVLEEVTKIQGLDTNKIPGTVEQTYKGATRSFAGTLPDNTFIDLTLDFNTNLNYTGGAGIEPTNFVLRTLRKWNDLIYDPLTGSMGIKAEYVAPQMTIVLHDKKQNPIWQWNCYHVFPTANIPAPQLDFANKKAIYSISGYKLRCDFWDEFQL